MTQTIQERNKALVIGLPFRFPGSESVYRALYQVTSADLLARATVWAGESPAAQNELFNVTNGDTLRWQHMWPRMAKMLGMEVADPVPFSSYPLPRIYNLPNAIAAQ